MVRKSDKEIPPEMNSTFRRYFDLTGVWETGSVLARRVALQVRANGSNTPRGWLIFAAFSRGGAGHASHAVNDFRKICGIEAYSPADNVSELTARINDDGWDSVFAGWLRGSRLSSKDMLFVFSVGGGNLEKGVSANLVEALKYGVSVGSKIAGVVGRDGGYTARVADACVVVPTVNPANVTPHTEAFQAVVWHLLVSHPLLKSAPTKWEAVQ